MKAPTQLISAQIKKFNNTSTDFELKHYLFTVGCPYVCKIIDSKEVRSCWNIKDGLNEMSLKKKLLTAALISNIFK